MNRNKALTSISLGYVFIALMFAVNVTLVSFVYFDLLSYVSRLAFLALGIFLIYFYAEIFPTKLLPSGGAVIKSVALMALPHVLGQLVVDSGEKSYGIIGYIVTLVVACFSAYALIRHQTNIKRYVANENYNDYVFFEATAFKAFEVNLYNVIYLFVDFFILTASNGDIITVVIAVVSMVLAVAVNYFRTRMALSDKNIKLSYYVIESISTAIAFALVIITDYLSLGSFVYIAAAAFMAPTVVMTALVYRSLNDFMYK